jgi:hypothetical protein
VRRLVAALARRDSSRRITHRWPVSGGKSGSELPHSETCIRASSQVFQGLGIRDNGFEVRESGHARVSGCQISDSEVRIPEAVRVGAADLEPNPCVTHSPISAIGDFRSEDESNCRFRSPRSRVANCQSQMARPHSPASDIDGFGGNHESNCWLRKSKISNWRSKIEARKSPIVNHRWIDGAMSR